VTDKQSQAWYRAPVQFLAVGFGSGLAPVAPGTFGTLPALLLWVPLSHLHWSAYLAVIVLMTAAGVWICDQASIAAGVDDHGSIVWDEIVGYLIALPWCWRSCCSECLISSNRGRFHGLIVK